MLILAAAAAAKSLQSCLPLCDPINGSPQGSTIPGILQARTLERVAISFSNAWKWKMKVKSFSHVRLLATPWTAAYQATRSMGFCRQEYWSGLPLPSLICRTRDGQMSTQQKHIFLGLLQASLQLFLYSDDRETKFNWYAMLFFPFSFYMPWFMYREFWGYLPFLVQWHSKCNTRKD